MAEFLVKTKGGANPKGKPRVYFTCHPDDFERYFEKLCEDIFRTHDCAIYYTKDMTEPLEEQNKDADLGQMNLFVVPVTFRLLTKPCRAMQCDIDYAKEKHIPILPFLMESGIDEFYKKPEAFGERQYLNPYSSDLTELRYEEKLKKHLEAILISDEMAKRVRAAFDAYIFLSYRKKDRAYANQLMRLIHEIPECRDIAIWYDEFLTPGESFQENIEKAMADSQLFTLLVTPNILEEPNGKPNFVMREEYPAAKEAHKEILPVEMQETDRQMLEDKFDGIPECINPQDKPAFDQSFIDALVKIARTENDHSPEHNFLIGLAYLDGIDVEVDRARALALITSAAEDGLIEAMKTLFIMYHEGKHVRINYAEALRWGKIIADRYKESEGEKSENSLTALNLLACVYGKMGNPEKARELLEQVYNCEYDCHEKDHIHTLDALNNLAFAYGKLGEHRKALEMHEQAHSLQSSILGEKHRHTLASLNNLAMTYIEIPDYEKALELNMKAYDLRKETLGEGDPDTILSLNNLAYTYGKLKKYDKALEIYKKSYELCCTVFGEYASNTITVLHNIANTYADIHMIDEEIETRKKICALSEEVFCEGSLIAVIYMHNLALAYEEKPDYENYVHTLEKLHLLCCETFGEAHSFTVEILLMIAVAYRKLGEEAKCQEALKKYKNHNS